MKFKSLPVWSKFEFDRSDLPSHLQHSLESGPWVKISPRKYVKDTNPFSLDQHDRCEHAVYSSLVCQVGSINASVIKL